MNPASILHPLAALVLSPLLLGVINRVKAIIAGRKGQPILQAYYDMVRLFQKGAVYSDAASWVFRAGPLVGLASTLLILAILPLGGAAAPISFTGDLFLMAYLFGLMRFFTVAAALDAGSAFEGMGASREMQFSVLAEPVLLLSLAALAQAGRLHPVKPLTGNGSFFSLSGIYSELSFSLWMQAGTVLLLAAAALLVVLLTENSRIPVDDPTTHLELTMIHEVMVLDHSGPDFGMILYAAALKLWIWCALLAGLVIPVRSGNPVLDATASIGGIFMLAAVIGLIESSMARLKLLFVPQMLAGAGVLSVLALMLVFWG